MRFFTLTRIHKMSLLCWLCLFVAGCGSSAHNIVDPPPPAPVPIGHVVLVVEENHSFSEVIGNTAMPYLNNLASTYGLATQYYADTHPSIGNYFMLSTGQIVTNNEAVTPATVTADNIVRDLLSAGKTWKSYAEGLPSVGYLGGDVYPYAQHHNPFVFLSDAITPAQVNNIAPFSQFATDLAASQLPNFSFVVPNQLNNAHDGTLAQADTWLSQNIGPLISSPLFQKDGLLIIVFDESDFTDLTNGGGHVAAVVVSARSKKGFQSVTTYQHQSTLRFILSSLGVTDFPGLSVAAPDMNEFLQ
jgi:phosphatidylinositol-3-phosphatase